MIDLIREQTDACALNLLRLVFKVQEDHEVGDWDADHVYCKKCEPPVKYPCKARRWAENTEKTMPTWLMDLWREQRA